jgi:hypothetical protein
MAESFAAPPTVKGGATVFVVAIDHRHGTNLGVYLTSEDADAGVAEWVELWWEHELPQVPRPAVIDHAAVRAYFEQVKTESFLIQQVSVEPVPRRGPPEPTDGDYLDLAFGFGTLDDLAQAVFERLGADDDVASVAEVKRRMAAYGPDALWERVIGPMLGRLEAALGFGGGGTDRFGHQ